MTDNELIQRSKFLSFVLRHNPDSIQLTLDKSGWANVKNLASLSKISELDIAEIVEKNNKQRFEYNENKTKIRACQGHSIEVDLKLTPKEPPITLYHGTSSRFIDSIKKEGLRSRGRNHVHLSLDKETALKVGQRHGGKTIILAISSLRYYNDEKARFYESTNGVWLADCIPYKYIEFDLNKKE